MIGNPAKASVVMRGKIITRHVYPPIPDRRWDWCAYHDGEELHCGWGPTEVAARADLERLDDERADYLEWKQQQEAGGA